MIVQGEGTIKAAYLLDVLPLLHQQIVVLETHGSVSGSLDQQVGHRPQGLEETRSHGLELRSETVYRKKRQPPAVQSIPIFPMRIPSLARSA